MWWICRGLPLGSAVAGAPPSFGGDWATGKAAAAAASSVVRAAWSVSTFFVIPLLALGGLGPGDALKRSVSLIRERWGEGLGGSASIGLAVFLVAVVPLYVLFQLTYAVLDVNVAAGASLGVLATQRQQGCGKEGGYGAVRGLLEKQPACPWLRARQDSNL